MKLTPQLSSFGLASIALSLTLALAACGGGGGGSSSGGGGGSNGGGGGSGTGNQPPGPAAVSIAVATARPGETITMTATSTDPQNSPVSYAWDFGDGSSGAGSSVTHAYSKEGSFNINVLATNQLGLSASAKGVASLQVAYLSMTPPNPFVTNYDHILGQSLTVNAAFLEPNGLPITYLWEFGDGATAKTLASSHTYAAVGTYIVKLTVTNSANHTVSASFTSHVLPHGALPARTDNTFSAFCSGTFCGATDATTYSGTGVGIWRYHNATASDATVNIVINGVHGGQSAVLVFSNGQSVAAPTVPSMGTLTTMSAGARVSAASVDAQDTPAARETLAHFQMLERNLADARTFVSRHPQGTQRVFAQAARNPVAATTPPALGTTRTWTDFFGGATPYVMQVGATCALSTGRNAVFWLDSGQVAAGKISPALIPYLVDGFCGPSGAYARLVTLVGDLWGSNATSANVIQDAPDALLDLNIVMPGVPNDTPWGGYFSSVNVNSHAFDPGSNSALAIFLNPTNLVLSGRPNAFVGSSLIHELKHHINYYQRTISRGVVHAVWLEETSAMLAEDLLTPPVFHDSRTNARFDLNGGNIGYIGWTMPEGRSYNLGALFGGFLHRWHGLDLDRRLIDSCNDNGAPEISYACMNSLIVQAGGLSFADEFDRVGASVYGGMGVSMAPEGFGLPSITREGYTLDYVSFTSFLDPNFIMLAKPQTDGYLPTSHTYQLDRIDAGKTIYKRDGVTVPAGTTLMVVVQ